MNKKNENYKNILIVGANGYLGSNLIEYLSGNSNYNITVMVNENINNIKNIKGINMYYFNRVSEYKLGSILDNIDIIFYVASIKNAKDYDRIYLENVIRPKNLAILASKHEVSKFIFTSSYQVNSLNNRLDEKNILKNYKLNYKTSKLILEKKLSELSNEKMSIYIIRFPMIVGKKMQGRLNFLFFAIKYNIPIPLKNSSYHLKLISMNDTIKILNLIKNYNSNKFTIFNFNTQINFTISELLNKISIYNKKKVINFYLPNFFINIILKFFNNHPNHLTANFFLNEKIEIISDSMNFFSLESNIDKDLNKAFKNYLNKL